MYITACTPIYVYVYNIYMYIYNIYVYVYNGVYAVAYAPPDNASAYVSIRQHTPAYVSIRQHTSAYEAYAPPDNIFLRPEATRA